MTEPGRGRAQAEPTDRPTHWQLAISGIRGHLLAAAAFSAGLNCLYLASPLFMLQIYDRVLATRSVTTLVFLFLALVIALVTLAVLDWARSRLLVRASVGLEERLAEPVTRHVLTAGRRPTALRELDQLRQGLSGSAPTALLDLPWAPIFLVVIALIHPLLALVAAVGAVGLFLLSLFSERAVRRSTKRANEISMSASSGLEACAASRDAVRGLGMRGALVRRHLDQRDEAGGLQTRASLASSGYQVAVRFLRLVLQSLVLAVGAWLAITGAITPGAMFAATILAARTLAPIDQLTAGWRSIVQAAAARASLAQVLDATPDVLPMTLPAPAGRLDVERVVVRRDGAEPVLKAISFSVGPGEILGIAGPSGSGKSTLARALVGAEELQVGAVRLDGAALSQWDEDDFGQHVGYLPQQVSLFAGTVGANIARFRHALEPDDPSLARDTVEAAELAGAHGMILRLPRGYETVLGPQGTGLSGGQAQRVALARALFGNPALVVLDEPNSALDSEGELSLLAALRKLKERGAAVVLVAHRASAMAMCDRILLLKDGAIELMGGRDEIFRGLSQARAKSPTVSAIAGGKT